MDLVYEEANLNIDEKWAEGLGFERFTSRSAKLFDLSRDTIKRLLERMEVQREAGFTIFLPDEQDKGKNILVESAEQNRVYVAFRKGGGEIFIKDPKMEDNHEEIKLADPALEPIPIIQTLSKDDALHVIMHILAYDEVPDPFLDRWPDEESGADD